MILLLTAIAVPVVSVVMFMCLKTAGVTPKNLEELTAEIKYQVYGILAIAEDFILISKNKFSDTYVMSDRVAVITGGNRGIGFEVLKKLIKCELTIILGVRNPTEAAKQVESNLSPELRKIAKLVYIKLDISSIESVKEFADIVRKKYNKIDFLINNAGVMAVPFKLTSDGFESQMAINYLGHFELTHLLLDLLKNAGTEENKSRIINVSSCVHKLGRINYDDFHGKKSYFPITAYNDSKLAQVLFTRYLEHLLQKTKSPVQVHATHPGVVDTDLFQYSNTSRIPYFKRAFFKTPEQGSRTIVYAILAKNLENKGGSYISNCGYAKMHPICKNMEECEKLFKYTCDMLNIKQFGDV